MPIVDNINSGELADILRRLRDLEHASPLFASSITQGRLRIGGSATLLVDSSGGLVIHGTISGDGTITWTGVLTNTGTTNLNGPVNIAGTQTVTGILNMNGPWNLAGAGGITGAVSCTGNWTWTGQLSVNAGGSISVAGTIPMSIANAAITFGSGGQVIGYATGVEINSGAAPNIVVSTGGVSISSTSGGPYLTVASGGHLLGAHKTTTSAANVFIDSTSGLVSRVTSAARFKVDAQPMALPDGLLDVPVKDWIDKGQLERGEVSGRIPGIIAEEVAAAGGESFVTYDAEGQTEGVAYDRLALARTQILADRLDAALTRIAELESKLAA